MPGGPRTKFHSAGLLTIWGLLVGSGMLVLGAYASRPGDAGAAPPRWPTETSLPLSDHVPTLLFFVHPRCPCSRASVAELSVVASQCGQRVAIQVVLLQPERPSQATGWSNIEADLAELPQATIRPDPGGVETRRFGIATSGHVLLYDPGGRLLFGGGITLARGHQGDNFGRSEVLHRILGKTGKPADCPVFGCSLATTGRNPSQGSP